MKLVNIKSAGGREGRPYKASGNSTRRGGYDSSCEEHVGPMQRAHAVGAETEQERPQSGDNPYIAQYLGKKSALIPSLGRERTKTLRGATQLQAHPGRAPLVLLMREGDRARLRARWWRRPPRGRLPGALSAKGPLSVGRYPGSCAPSLR